MVTAIISDVLTAYLIVLLLRVVLSWFPIDQASPLVPVVRVLHSLTEPVLAPIRRVLPQPRPGGVGLDLSPVIAVLVIIVLRQLLA